jgi:hypothetical protein
MRRLSKAEEKGIQSARSVPLIFEQCVFTSEDLPCEYCRTHETADACVRQWGQKKEQSLAVARPIPTANDEVIRSQDVLLLQYGYSDTFFWAGGTLMSGLLRKFAFVFSPAINDASLRHAMLAFIAAYLPSDIDYYERIVVHSELCGKELMSKNPATLNEADLFAAFLLTWVSCIRKDVLAFRIHLKGFSAILEELSFRNGRAGTSHQLSVFWPLARDLILEGSRMVDAVDGASGHIIEFCGIAGQTMGPQKFSGRARYLDLLVRADPNCHTTFSQAVWHHCGLLRRCLRYTVPIQKNGGTALTTVIQPIVTDIKADLDSLEMKNIAFQLSLMKLSQNDTVQFGRWTAYWQFMLLLYQYDKLMIVLLEAETVEEGASSCESANIAVSILQIMKDQITSLNIFSLYLLDFNTSLLPRILWVSGLMLIPETYTDGMKSYFPSS